MELPATAAAAIEIALNRWLALDPGSESRLRPLEGRTVALHLTAPETTLYFLFVGGRVAVGGRAPATPPHAFVRGAPPDLARLALRPPDGTAGVSGVEVGGDTHVVQAFRDLLAEVDIDWEEELSKGIGDIAAHGIGEAMRKVRGWFGRTGDRLREDTGDWLREESGLLPNRCEIEPFLDGVDRLRDGVERLEARIARVERGRRSGTPA